MMGHGLGSARGRLEHGSPAVGRATLAAELVGHVAATVGRLRGALPGAVGH
jgi:hypothetical protein